MNDIDISHHPPLQDSQQLSDGQINSFQTPNPMITITMVTPPTDSPYANLGDIEEVDLLSFSYQIAAGMVRDSSGGAWWGLGLMG